MISLPVKLGSTIPVKIKLHVSPAHNIEILSHVIPVISIRSAGIIILITFHVVGIVLRFVYVTSQFTSCAGITGLGPQVIVVVTSAPTSQKSFWIL